MPDPKKTSTKKSVAKKPVAKKPAAKKSAPKKAPARKPAAKKAPPKKAAAGKVATKKAPVTKRKAPVEPPPLRSAEELRREAAQALALKVAAAGLDKKAERIEIIDVTGKADYTDFLVLMSGRSDRQVQAIAQGIEAALHLDGVRPRTTEGLRQGEWVIVDFSDVLVHVFQEEERRHRDLESLWMDARRVPFAVS